MSQQSKRNLTGGTLLLLAILFVALVVVIDILFRGARVDLTENELYSISDGTERILASLDEPINLYFYFSKDASSDIPVLRTYGNRVREMLEEFEARADGKIRLEVIDPEPFSEEEDEASAFGLQAVPAGPGGENLFLGLAGTNSLDDTEVIPFFQLDKEAFLEYDLAKLVHSLARPDRPVIGVMSSLPIGRGFDPTTRQMRDPWIVMQQLEQLFEVRQLTTSEQSIADEIEVLLLVHPKGLSDSTLYAIDQFVMRGGRLIAVVDPQAEIDQPAGMDPQAAMFAERSSDLDRLFSSWGIAYDPEQVVLDADNGLQVGGGAGRRPLRHIGVLSIGAGGMNDDEVVLANLDSINVALAGHVAAAPEASFEFVPLLTTSERSATVPADRVRMLPDPTILLDDFVATEQAYVLAARIQGPLDSAFPDGAPGADGDEGDAGDEAEPPAAPIAATEAANIIVLADADLLADRMWVQVQQFFGQRLATAFASNGDFVLNMVDAFAGSSDLISIRGRATSRRPFLRVEALQREAEDRFRATEQQLERELQETERKLTELQTGRAEDGALILSPEQQAELERFRQERVRIRKELRGVQAELRSDIEDLGTWLKVINIGLVPLLLTVLALVLAAMRAKQRETT